MELYDFRQDAATFFDSEGFFGQWRNPPPRSTNNSLLYTGIYYALLVRLGLARTEDLIAFDAAVSACWVPGHEGLLYRHPMHNDIPQEHDDYIGVAAAAYFLKSSIAKKIAAYGRANDWYFDSLRPGSRDLSKWHGRFLGVVPHYKNCEDESFLGIPDQLGLSIDVCGSAFSNKDSTSGKILDWLKIIVVDEKYAITNLSILLWRWRMRKMYPNGMGDVFATYFKNDGGYGHPFSKATMGVL